MKKLSIIIPCYNEAKSLNILYNKFNEFSKQSDISVEEEKIRPSDYEWELLFVNDGSKDNTLEVLQSLREKDNRVNFINLSRNFGKENAMLAGMDYASGDAVIIMDADLQHPVEKIPEMIYWWQKGYSDVYGKRLNRKHEPWIRKHFSPLYYKMLQKATNLEITPNVGDFRLIDRQMLESLKQLRETQRYTKGLYSWVGYNKKEILYDTQDRASGKSSFNIRALINLAVDGITGFTTAPLRLSMLIGFIVSFISIAYIIFIIFKTILYGETVQGFPTLMCVILFLGGVQLISIGIIGEYIGRIFNETKNRPTYIAESFNGDKISPKK